MSTKHNTRQSLCHLHSLGLPVDTDAVTAGKSLYMLRLDMMCAASEVYSISHVYDEVFCQVFESARRIHV